MHQVCLMNRNVSQSRRPKSRWIRSEIRKCWAVVRRKALRGSCILSHSETANRPSVSLVDVAASIATEPTPTPDYKPTRVRTFHPTNRVSAVSKPKSPTSRKVLSDLETMRYAIDNVTQKLDYMYLQEQNMQWTGEMIGILKAAVDVLEGDAVVVRVCLDQTSSGDKLVAESHFLNSAKHDIMDSVVKCAGVEVMSAHAESEFVAECLVITVTLFTTCISCAISALERAHDALQEDIIRAVQVVCKDETSCSSSCVALVETTRVAGRSVVNQLVEGTRRAMAEILDHARDSLDTRRQARCEIALSGGLERFHESILANHWECLEAVEPYVQMLTDPSCIEEVKSFCVKRVRFLQNELDTLSAAKYANQELQGRLRDGMPEYVNAVWQFHARRANVLNVLRHSETLGASHMHRFLGSARPILQRSVSDGSYLSAMHPTTPHSHVDFGQSVIC